MIYIRNWGDKIWYQRRTEASMWDLQKGNEYFGLDGSKVDGKGEHIYTIYYHTGAKS